MKMTNVYFTIFHIFCWIMVIVPALIFVPENQQDDIMMFLMRLTFPLLMCILFYLNYLWLVPKYFMEHKQNVFIIVNVIVMLLFAIIVEFLMEGMHHHEIETGMVPPEEEDRPISFMLMLFVARNVFSLALSVFVATLLRLAVKWYQTETARKDIAKQKTEAELEILRNQFSPHFLLNTLNNIYALISFDSEKAQKAVLSLSAMLRQILSGSNQSSVALNTELDFLRHYIDLMKLRMTKSVKIDVNMPVANNNINVAPFIFVSLVENAFKHGVSLTEPCFISIDITSDDDKIVCEIKNTNFPKSSSDKSGHGIGLKQVAQRLNLAYSGKYEWTKGTDENNIYTSKIIIYDTQLRNN